MGYFTRSALVLGLASILVVGFSAPASAAPVSVTIGGIAFSADDSNVAAGATVTGYTPGSTDVTIPSSVEIAGQAYEVAAIAGDAFRAKGLTSVTIPSTVSSIGDNAFRSNNLTSVAIPPGVTSISLGAFAFNNLASVSIPGTVTIIRDSAFRVNNLSSIVIPLGVTTIEVGAFLSNSLTSVTLSETVSVIGESAFRANQLTTVTIPSSVTSIGASAFHINPLTSVVMLGTAPAVGGEFHFGTANPVVTYPWRNGSPPAVDGYTSPTWQGYRSQAVAQVAFDAVGGSAVPASQQVVLGSTVIKPADPSRVGFEFAGWFTAASGGQEWDFASALSDSALSTTQPADLTLYAQWTAPELAATGGRIDGTLGLSVVLLLVGSALVAVRYRLRGAKA